MLKGVRGFSFLSKQQIAGFNQSGFLVLPGLVPKGELAVLKERALQLVGEWVPSESHSFFSTKDQDRLADDYFFASASNISFFREEKATKTTQKNDSVNKIAHALHDLDSVYQHFSYRSEYREILTDLGYIRPSIVQSMHIMKSPGIGGEVTPHQDRSYIISSPASCIGFWVALEDASPENACMYASPGSHMQGTRLFWGRSEGGMKFDRVVEYDISEKTCLAAEAGTVILLHGDLVHWSPANESRRSRHAYTLHIVETQGTVWSTKNWLQRAPALPFKVFK